MKKILFLLVLFILLIVSCDFISDKTIKADLESLEDIPVSIYNGDSLSEEIYSYQASVTSYYRMEIN